MPGPTSQTNLRRRDDHRQADGPPGDADPDLRQVCPDVSSELAAIFNKMLAKKIEDRYQSMPEVVADLERCVAGQSTSVSFPQSASSQHYVLAGVALLGAGEGFRMSVRHL